MPVKSILCAHDPHSRKWRLPQAGAGTLSLIGWRTNPIDERDDGVPSDVGIVLAKALTTLGEMSFPCSEPFRSNNEDGVQELPLRSFRATLRRLATKEPKNIRIVSTRNVDVARQAFDDAGFPWWLQGQIAVVRSGDRAASTDAGLLLDMIENADAPNWAQLLSLSINIVIRPGVDGGVMGLYADSVSTRDAFTEMLERSALATGYEWLTMSERQFTDAIAEPWC